jgi:DNA repair protein RadC
MNPNAEHRKRMRQRVLKKGLEGFEDYQLLELLLCYSIPRKDTRPLAKELLAEFHGLSGVLDAHPRELMGQDGVGENTAVFLHSLPETFKRYESSKFERANKKINSTSLAGDYIQGLCKKETYEVFYLVCLDAQKRVISADKIADGTLDQAPVYTRNIVEAALRNRAHSVILAHNHPGGTARPSRADVEVTGRVKEALDTIGVTVVDHIISAGDRYVSFVEEDLL